MRDLDDPELLAYLTAENEYASSWFAPHESTMDTLFEEIRSRVQETDMSVPVRSGDWWYVTSTVEGSSYPIHHRGPTAAGATAQVLLDENVEAEGHDYFDVGAFDMSHDHTLAAWSFDTEGDDDHTLTFATSPPASISAMRSRTCRTQALRGRVTVHGSSTSPPTNRSARTGCGATHCRASAPTTCSCSRRSTSAISSVSARPGRTTSSSSSRRARRAVRCG